MTPSISRALGLLDEAGFTTKLGQPDGIDDAWLLVWTKGDATWSTASTTLEALAKRVTCWQLERHRGEGRETQWAKLGDPPPFR